MAIIVFICGNLRLGFLIDFISQPVIAGFTSGAALTIASGQIKVRICRFGLKDRLWWAV